MTLCTAYCRNLFVHQIIVEWLEQLVQCTYSFIQELICGFFPDRFIVGGGLSAGMCSLEKEEEGKVEGFLLSRLDSCIGPRPPVRGSSITLRHTTLCRTPLGKESACRGDFYLTTHNTHKRQKSRASFIWALQNGDWSDA